MDFMGTIKKIYKTTGVPESYIIDKAWCSLPKLLTIKVNKNIQHYETFDIHVDSLEHEKNSCEIDFAFDPF